MTNSVSLSYGSKQILIDSKRWEPVSAVVSASLHTAGSMGRAAAAVVTEPYQAYKDYKVLEGASEGDAGQSGQQSQLQQICSGDTATAEKASDVKQNYEPATETGMKRLSEVDAEQGPSSPNTVRSAEEVSRSRTRQVVKTTARSAGKLIFSPVKGVMLDIPLAAVEGMWALPRLHGDTGYQRKAITDWKSGGSVAVKSFAHGIQEGLCDIFVKTYAAKKKEGAKGVAKGLSMGFVNLTMKTGAGTLGLLAYPCQGVYKSIHAAMHAKARKVIEQAKLEEGEWLVSKASARGPSPEEIVTQFLSARPGKGKGRM